jgi:hypothetical protein
MNHVIAVAVKLKRGKPRFFVTWGRTFGSVDGTEIEKIVLTHCKSYALGGIPVKAEVCYSLLDASKAPYFYEALMYFSEKPIPGSGVGYARWKKRIAREQRLGHHLMYCGDPDHREQCRSHFWSMGK